MSANRSNKTQALIKPSISDSVRPLLSSWINLKDVLYPLVGNISPGRDSLFDLHIKLYLDHLSIEMYSTRSFYVSF